MEDNFTNGDFEEFLQEQVRNHRMYPKDTVWRDINKKLHGDKKWPALTIAAVALLAVTVIISVYFSPKPNLFAVKHATPSTNNSIAVGDDNSVLNKLTPQKGKANNPILTNDNYDQQNPSTTTASVPATTINIPVIQNRVENVNTSKSTNIAVTSTITRTNTKTLQSLNNSGGHAYSAEPKVETLKSSSLVAEEKVTARKGIAVESVPVDKDFNDKNMVDNFLKDHKSDLSLFTSPKKRSSKNKFGYQIYVAPSISYRKLNEDPAIEKGNTTGPVGLNYVTDVNNVVRHKPGTGIEAGVAWMYYLSNKIKVKSGLQFNVREYSIEAYRSSTELASIALISNNGFDTVNTYAIYRTRNGYDPAELVNRYYQLSIPIGIEWEIIGNKKVQLNVAGSIQPTYLLNNNAYLLTTNFKNYTESPDMVRRWNINSNIETFISIKAGDYKWQLGPQLRYQPYSTFIRQYPIKEHLLDYGFKLGVSKILH